MLLWLVIGAFLLILATKIDYASWYYSGEAAGILYAIGMAFVSFAGHGLVFLEESGFQALGLILTVLAILFMVTGLLIAIATVAEMTVDFVSDIVRGKMDE